MKKPAPAQQILAEEGYIILAADVSYPLGSMIPVTHVDALQPQLQSSVIGENIRRLIPEFAIDSISVAVLEIGDFGLIVQRAARRASWLTRSTSEVSKGVVPFGDLALRLAESGIGVVTLAAA